MKHFKFILPLIFLVCTISARANSEKFYTFSNSHINNIYQDSEGFMWICSEYGLNKFDGQNVTTYYHTNDSTSLVSNSVLTVTEDRDGYLWIGTADGIQRFNKATEKFESIKLSYPHITSFNYISSIIEDSKGNIWFSTSRSGIVCLKNETREPIYYLNTNSNICSNKINVLFEDRFGNIWIGSQDNGISILNTNTQSITSYRHDPNNDKSLSSNKIYSIVEAPSGNILVGTIDGGIDLYDYTTNTFTRNYIQCSDNVYVLSNDSKKNIWIGTDGAGLKYYDFESQKISTYQTNLQNIDFNRLKIHDIFEDKQGNIWVAIYQKGVMMIPPNPNRFKNIWFNPFNPSQSIGTECALSVMSDHNGDIWIGTDGDGIYRLDRNRTVKKHYHGNSLHAKSILSIMEDSSQNVWAASFLYGLFKYNPGSDSFEHISLSHNGIEVKDINVLYEGPDKKIWIGTNQDGLVIFDPQTKHADFYQYNLMKTRGQILSNSIQAIHIDNNGNAWIGTSDAGISCYNLKNRTFTDYNIANGKLANNSIYSIRQDSFNNLWVGTKGGLISISPKGEAKVFTEKNGLANSTIYSIEIDNSNNLWISTCNGLSKYDTTSQLFTNFFTSDGIANNEFRRGASFHAKDGKMYFGGTNGVTTFVPFDSENSTDLLNLVLTDLYIYNDPVEIDDNGILTKALNNCDKIYLRYDVKNFSIGYSCIEYNSPERVTYQVMLENFDQTWKEQSLKSRLITYTNLKPGEYILRIKASLPGGPELERSLKIIITPPFWLTWWAKVIYFLLIVAIAYATTRYIRKELQRKHNDLVKENDKKIMESKIQFFTDISHEIRTPLTLILSPIEQLIKQAKNPEDRHIFEMIDQNGKRILRLVNQVMELRKLDKSEVTLKAEKTDIKAFLTTIFNSFTEIAKEKEIDYQLTVNDPMPEIWIDHDKIDKVIFNILSNAFKYTPQKGQISLKADIEDNKLCIRVSDSGIGIPKEYQESIFERFYQIPTEHNISKIGTGIGLHLARRLAELHKGRLIVEQSSSNGTVFLLQLLCDDSYLKPEEKLTWSNNMELATITQPSAADFIEKESEVSDNTKAHFSILIVEDDTDILNYLSEILGANYKISTATNGRIGLEKAIKEMPDCVITDIMMPEMNGIELCKKIKTNTQTCHIPVIMLTAKTSVEQRVEGLAVGADSYIPKPFNVEHLKTRINKLIELRQTMKDKFSGKLEIKEEDVKVKSTDERLIERLEALVNKELANPALSVELLSSELGISRSQLQRKLKQLTNQNPSDFIKTTRLRNASFLLTQKGMSISETAYATGFSSLSHFSNSFREFYGMSPSKYVEIHKKDTTDADT